jgi:uncharacterized membrane protein YkvA (DUF1232 family)
MDSDRRNNGASASQGADSGPTAPNQPVDPVLERFWTAVRRLPHYLALGVNLARDGRVPTGAKTAVMLGGAYAVSPIDLVPGIIPVAGQLDDMMVVLVALRRAIRACPPALAAEHLARAGLTADDFDGDLAACRATARWLAMKGVRLGRRLATAAGRRLWATIQQRAGPGQI